LSLEIEIISDSGEKSTKWRYSVSEANVWKLGLAFIGDDSSAHEKLWVSKLFLADISLKQKLIWVLQGSIYRDWQSWKQRFCYH